MKRTIGLIIVIVVCIMTMSACGDYTQYLEKGDYAKAYDTCKDKNEKLFISGENAVAASCGRLIPDISNPKSLYLKNAWFSPEVREVLVEICMENYSGKTVTSWCEFHMWFGKGDWKICPEDEDYASRTLKNFKDKNSCYQLDNKAIQRINRFAKNDELRVIDLIDDSIFY